MVPRTSDVDYKCFLYLREFVRRGVATACAPTILFDLLQSSGAAVRTYNVARTRALLDELAVASGRIPSADDLHREIARRIASTSRRRGMKASLRIILMLHGAGRTRARTWIRPMAC